MLESWIDTFGTAVVLALAGVIIGAVFGAFAERSSFCLRAATVELAERQFGPRLVIWLLAFATALVSVQVAVYSGVLDLGDARVFSAQGSLSGAVIGGLLFGTGMILARGCASRLLVLAATGNLRALVTGLVLTLVAQAAYTGVLSPLRTEISQLWTIPAGPGRSIAVQLGVAEWAFALIAVAAMGVALVRGSKLGVGVTQSISAMGVGLAVMAGWMATFLIAQNSFDVVPISSITFTGPATDTLMVLVDQRGLTLSFGIGLVPGVAIGAGTSALWAGRWQIQRFEADVPMERYLIGAVMMGFGAMLAGGCAVGSGLSGGAALSLTSWIAVFCMWFGAMATHQVMRRQGRGANAIRT